MVSARTEGKNVRGEDGQDEQQQWKMSRGTQRERSVRWCVKLCAGVLRCRRSVSFDENGVLVLSAEWVQPKTGQKYDGVVLLFIDGPCCHSGIVVPNRL